MSSRADFRKNGFTIRPTEIEMFRPTITMKGDLEVVKSLVVENISATSFPANILGNLTCAGNIVSHHWGMRKYMELDFTPMSSAQTRYMVIPEDCYLKTIRAVIDGDPGSDMYLAFFTPSSGSYYPFYLLIPNGALAGDVYAHDYMFHGTVVCGAGEDRAIIITSGVNAVTVHVLAEFDSDY